MKKVIFWMIFVLTIAFIGCGDDDDVNPDSGHDAGEKDADSEIPTDVGNDDDDDNDDVDAGDDDDDDVVCVPTNGGIEKCDNIDNDCDGEIDEDGAGCDDGLWCNGTEICEGGYCVLEEEEPPDCSSLNDHCAT